MHSRLFTALNQIGEQSQRAERFMDYTVVQFRLHHLEDAGLVGKADRGKADYLRLLRGWLFNPDGREAAVLKGWVESRFGLLPRYHQGQLKDHDADNYQQYLAARSEGLYGTNALEAQLDLLYSYCQYELAQRYQPDERLHLYRGVNHLDSYDILSQTDKHHSIMLLNNLNAFSRDRERAGEFGDILIEADIPWQKSCSIHSCYPENISARMNIW